MRHADHVLRVFTDDEGRWGNQLGVVLGTADWDDARCQERAALLGFSETVFVDDADTGRIRIFTPTVKFAFAGHPTVGTAWLLRHLGHELDSLSVDAGLVRTSATAIGATVLAKSSWCPPFTLRPLPSPTDVDAASSRPNAHDYVWSWIDQERGVVRARAFVTDAGIDEDEATGAAAIRLAGELHRPLRIHQGRGSVIDVGPSASDMFALSGRVTMDQ